MAFPFFTIGHSNRPVSEFIALLTAAGVDLVVDVRTIPRSRTNPQYNRETLPDTLARSHIAYQHLAELGGRRPLQRNVDPTVNGFWENQSFHNYADYAMGGGFAAGLARLRELGHAHTSAIMCAEAVWWRCHRRIIADYLTIAGEQVLHLMGPGKTVPASLTPQARPGPDGTLIYPSPQVPLPL